MASCLLPPTLKQGHRDPFNLDPFNLDPFNLDPFCVASSDVPGVLAAAGLTYVQPGR